MHFQASVVLFVHQNKYKISLKVLTGKMSLMT